MKRINVKTVSIILGGLILGVTLAMFLTIKQGTVGANRNQQIPEGKATEGLTEKQKQILYLNGTETPYTSDLLKEKRKGTYYAVDTKQPVFRSEDKYDSGTGWPSFVKPITPDAVKEEEDLSGGMTRTGILSTAGGHLGHVFPDGPKDRGGLRYCINGDVLYFVPDEVQ